MQQPKVWILAELLKFFVSLNVLCPGLENREEVELFHFFFRHYAIIHPLLTWVKHLN